MIVKIKIPEKNYPYLAVWVGVDQQLDVTLLHNLKQSDIVLISQIESGNDIAIYVQYVLGGKLSYVTANENEYCPLPYGYSLTLCQS